MRKSKKFKRSLWWITHDWRLQNISNLDGYAVIAVNIPMDTNEYKDVVVMYRTTRYQDLLVWREWFEGLSPNLVREIIESTAKWKDDASYDEAEMG